MHALCPVAGWYFPAAHTMHTVLRLDGATLPAAHALHDACPATEAIRPAAHGVHWRSDAAVRLAETCVPAVQLWATLHSTLPVSGWNVPSAHALHTVERAVPLLEVPRSQGLQLSCSVAFWYLPASQPLHVVCPCEFWYWPAAQPSQFV